MPNILKEKLLPGADWEYEIRKAVGEADVVVVCLSKQFNQAGFRQKEVRIALDAAMEKLEGEICIIPARLEECDTLESLIKWHWVDLFERDGYQRLLLALRRRATVSRPKAGVNAGQASSQTQPSADSSNPPAQKAEELEKQRLAQEKAERETADKAAREKAHLEAEEAERRRLAKEKADREAADAARIIREKAEKDAAEKARLEADEAEKRRLAREKAERGKTLRRPNTAAMIGGIGLVGIIFVAVIASLWGDLFPSAPEPTATLFFTATETKQPTPTKMPAKFFTPTAAALPAEIMDNGVPMRLVPAGEFTMGSENGASDETPVHKVYLDAFYMDKYEVANALYRACVQAGGCTPPGNTSSYARSSYYGNSNFDNYPVVYVSWHQAQTYCKWRGARLPTEAEWEKAARGTDGRTYPWGEGIDCDKANYWRKEEGGCKGDTTPVGSYESGKSPYGIYDLAGNVWEWTANWYSETYYQNSPFENPPGPDSGQYRALRGGSWFNYDFSVRSANRFNFTPDVINSYVGFRCARSLP